MERAQDQPDRRCQHCGTELTGETAGGLCPRCLLEMNFASRTMPGGEPSPQMPPPSPEEMAARFPQFEILECLGRGGMGIVYKARQKTLDRQVAIKVLAGEWSNDPQFAERFSREARTLAKLSHPNIVTVHDFGESDGMFYLVMEFVDGVNLRDVLRDGRMEPAEALAVVPSICEALQFAHDQGVVHRDIKPENILMDRNGRVKIADFGIATLVGADADRSGTPPYMAPEQGAGGGIIDHRADIYALGVVFYEMLTGERPERDPSRPSQRVELDVRLDEVVLRALEKEPARRYQTAGEFRTVVETMAGRGSGAANRRQAASDAGGAVRWRRFFAPLVVVRNGERVIHWPGVVRDALLLAGIYSIAWLLAVAALSPLLGTPPPAAVIGGIIGFLSAMLGFGFYRSFKTPVDRLRHVDQRISDAESKRDNRNRWELTIILAGTLFFVLFSAFTWEWTGPLRVLLIAISVLGMAICVLSLAGFWPFPSPFFPRPNFSARHLQSRRARLVMVWAATLIVVGTAAVILLQRPRLIDDRAITADSPDGMFRAMGRTWHAMRIFDSDRTFYQFIVQGKSGAVFENWEVDVPYDKVATSYTLRSLDGIRFGKHGRIVWSDDSKRVSFRVNGVEVAGFDTGTGKPTGAEDEQAARERVARGFFKAMLRGDVEGTRALLAPLSPLPHEVDLKEWVAEDPSELRKDYGGDDWRLTTFAEWLTDGGWAVARTTSKPDDSNEGVYVVLQRTHQGWGVVYVETARHDVPLRHYLDRVRPFAEASVEKEATGLPGVTPEGTLQAYSEACFIGDAEKAMTFLAPPLSETPEDVRKAILLFQVHRGEDAERPEIVEWHEDGAHAVARYRSPPEAIQSQMPIKPYVILEKTGRGWKVVWSSVSLDESSLADELRTFREFLSVDRKDPEKVAGAFIRAARKGDSGMALMLSGFPLRDNPGDLVLEFERANRDMPDSEPAGPLCWLEEGPYAVTRAKLPGDRPEVESCLVLRKTGMIWWVVWTDTSVPDTSLADDLKRFMEEPMTTEIMIEDLALRFLVAIREKDEQTLRELCVDRTEGWTEALVGPFSMELRGRFRQLTGEEFTLYPGTLRVDWKRKDKDLAVVRCLAARELQEKLGGNILVLHFCRSDAGWKVWTVRNASESRSLEEHLGQAREWAAEWDDEGPDAESVEEIKSTTSLTIDLNTIKQYATALATYRADTGSLPPNLEMLVARTMLPEPVVMENHATGKKERPLYHGGPDLRVEEFDPSKFIVLAAPSPSPDSRRVVGFLDASVKVIEESRYQSQLAWQQKPPMERTIDAFLESCARKGITHYQQLFDELGIVEFIERYGNGQPARRKHREQLHPVMRWAFDETTGEPSAAFTRYLRGVHRDGDPRHAKQAFLMLQMLGVEEHLADGASAEALPQSERDMLLAHAETLEKGDFAVLEQTWEFQDNLERRYGRLLANAFARQEAMTVELVSTQRLNENSLFACYLVRNGPERFGSADAPLFATFQRRGDRWRCTPSFSLRTEVVARTMGDRQIGRRGIAEQLIHQRYGHGDGAGQLGRMKAMRDAAARLARPPHKLMMYEGLAESLKAAIRNAEQTARDSWRDSWRRLIKEQPKEILPGPGDFFVSFYRECDPGDAQFSRELPIAGEQETFRAERFPCLTDSIVVEALVKDEPGSDHPQIEIRLTAGGTRLFESVARQSIGKHIACVVDEEVISAPKVMTSIDTGRALITGSFSREEAEAIVKKINTFRDQARDFLDSLEKEEQAAGANR